MHHFVVQLPHDAQHNNTSDGIGEYNHNTNYIRKSIPEAIHLNEGD